MVVGAFVIHVGFFMGAVPLIHLCLRWIIVSDAEQFSEQVTLFCFFVIQSLNIVGLLIVASINLHFLFYLFLIFYLFQWRAGGVHIRALLCDERRSQEGGREETQQHIGPRIEREVDEKHHLDRAMTSQSNNVNGKMKSWLSFMSCSIATCEYL